MYYNINIYNLKKSNLIVSTG